MKFRNLLYLTLSLPLLAACTSRASAGHDILPNADTLCVDSVVRLGDERPDLYLPALLGKKVALLSNHTGIDRDSIHILDKLLASGVHVTTLFSPEHGFRGTADAGEHIKGSVDARSGLPIVSLYGGGFKGLTPAQLDSIDVIAVDLQDVGTRFYTYYITMLRLMNEAAVNGKEFLIFDRPNPNGMVVDGPTLQADLYSGVGKLPIPVSHGMTLGELAQMINGEGWLDGGRKVDLKVIPVANYSHSTRYQLLTRPSPNLKSMHSIYLYPSTCLFEGTNLSLGRGTDHPFEVYGAPSMTSGDYYFTPRSMPGASEPPMLGKRCRGADLTAIPDDDIIAGGVDLTYIIDAYHAFPDKTKFFIPFFDKLIGNRQVRRMIEQGSSAADIKATWADDVAAFRKARAPYLIYPE